MREKKTMYVGVQEICDDWGVSRSKAYAIIKQLSKQMQEENPKLLTMAGKINRTYYEEVCMKRQAAIERKLQMTSLIKKYKNDIQMSVVDCCLCSQDKDVKNTEKERWVV